MIIIMILFLALRYHTGWDYHWYLKECENVAKSGTTDREMEYAWIYIFSIGKIFNLYWLPISIVGIATMLLIYNSLKLILLKESYIKTALLVFVLFPDFYISTFSIIRQWLAIAVCLFIFAVFYSSKKKLYPLLLYITTVIFSYFFLHKSSGVMIIFIPIYLIDKIFNRHKMMYLFLLSVMTLIILNIFTYYIQLFPGYQIYFGIEQNYGKLMRYIVIAMLIFVLIYYYKLKKEQEIDVFYYLFIIGSIVSIAILFENKFAWINRISLYFTVCIIYIFPYIFNKIKKDEIKIILITFLLSLFFFNLYRFQDTKAVKGGMDHYIPYKTILFTD